ncbi:MAG: hypothetical protein ACP5LT_10025, partial [Candidatus Kapaibacteriota bacterium]
YNSQTFSGSGPYNIAPGYDVVYVTSTVGAAITINLPTSAVEGQTLYIIWNDTNNATFSNGLRPDGSPYQTSGAANLLFVYAGDRWRLVSAFE